MKDVSVVDQPRWPALDATGVPARMSFRLEWKATDQPIRYENVAQHFLVQGFLATAQLEAQVEVPSIGFAWKSDPLQTSHSDFAMIGDEVNGRYYDIHTAASS
jgi:hypothetical protein